MGSRVGLDMCGKSRPPPGFDPRNVEPVASRYIDYDIRPMATSSTCCEKFGPAPCGYGNGNNSLIILGPLVLVSEM